MSAVQSLSMQLLVMYKHNCDFTIRKKGLHKAKNSILKTKQALEMTSSHEKGRGQQFQAYWYNLYVGDMGHLEGPGVLTTESRERYRSRNKNVKSIGGNLETK